MKKSFIVLVLLQTTLAIAQHDTVIDPLKNSIQNSEMLKSTMEKLDRLKTNADSNFIVAHFGDSHIQGDGFSGVIRNNLQQAFGSAGEGMLFPYSVCKSFGPKNLTTTVTGTWSYANLLKNPEKYPIGVTGYTLVTKDKAATISFIYNPTGEVPYGDNKIFETVTIWHSENNFRLVLVNNESADKLYSDSIKSTNGLYRTIITNYRIGSVLKLQFESKGSSTIFNFHGITFENPSQHGLQYSRCGVVGATFTQLVAQQEFTIAQLKEMKPDLLIFSYGSNESYDKNLDVESYYNEALIFIRRLRTEFPGVGVIITNTPDTRAGNRIPANTNAINEKLKQIAAETGSAYWDLNTIMGGTNSIFYWLKNGLARKDQLHFTRAGYSLQANLFSYAFLKNYNDEYKNVQPLCDSLLVKIDKQLTSLNTTAKAQQATENVSAGNEEIHVVKKGETLFSIAKQYKITVKQLCAWNGITEKAVLRVGQKLMIRKA